MKYSSLNALLYLSHYYRIRCIEVISLELSWMLQRIKYDDMFTATDKQMQEIHSRVYFRVGMKNVRSIKY